MNGLCGIAYNLHILTSQRKEHLCMRYFYNSWDSAYKSHFGAIARNQSCQFTIRLPEETPLRNGAWAAAA